MESYCAYMRRTRGRDNLRSLKRAFRAFSRAALVCVNLIGVDPYNDTRGAL